MSDEDDTTINVKGLESLAKALKNPPVVRIGILGTKAERTGGGKNNATIGAIHEFGSDKLPVRSFLRMPLTILLKKRLEQGGAFDEATLKKIIDSGSILLFMKKIAIMGEAIVLGAFDSAGYGIWPPSNMRSKKNKQTLVETQQLRNSITSEVVQKSGK